MRRPSVLANVLIVGALGCLAIQLMTAQEVAAPGGTVVQPMEGTAAVSGVVTDATTRQPIPGALVYLGFQGRGAVGRLSRQISDPKGRFVFTDLPAGNNYFIAATKFGYLEGRYGVGAIGGLLGGLITLTDGQWFREANLTMRRGGSISGTVLDEQGAPAVGVYVRLLLRMFVAGRQQVAAGPSTRTDDRGAYRLADLTPGLYAVQVPFVQQTISASLSNADLAGLSPEMVAAGRPVPEPLPALDLQGAARLIAGAYLLAPSIGGRARTYPPMFYPAVTSLADASWIEIKPGEDRAGIDMPLRAVPTTSISGIVNGPTEVLASLVIRLMPDGIENLGAGSEVATATTGADGRFVLAGIPEGTYTVDVRRTVSELQYRAVLAQSPPSFPATPGVVPGRVGGAIGSGPIGASVFSQSSRGSAGYFSRSRISVGASPMTNVTITLQRGASISGRFATDTGDAPEISAERGTASVLAEPADGNVGLGLLSASTPTPTTFQIAGLLPGTYLLRINVGDYLIAAVTADGQDRRVKGFDGAEARDFDVTVTLTKKTTNLSGRVADASGGQVPNAIVIAFPVERDQWTNYGLTPFRLRSFPSTSSGTYQFESLPPGEYYLVGVPPDSGGVWQDPANLAKLAASASRVSLAWGDVKTQNVTVVKWP